MSIVIGINGFGRIGRSVLRAAATRPESGIAIGAINDLGSPEGMAYSLRYDSTRGAFPGSVDFGRDRLEVDGKAVRTFHCDQPELIPWRDAGVEVVIEATGRFRTRATAQKHIVHGGARKVVISAPADDPDAYLVVDVNHGTYDAARHNVVSPASCGVNALTVMAKVMMDRFGLHDVSASVLLSTQSWQTAQDVAAGPARNDPRLGRAGAESIIPYNYVARDPLRVALPELGEMRYSFYCVPTPIGSLAELSGRASRPVDIDMINRAMGEEAGGPLRRVLGFAADPTVSIDVRDNPASCLFDPTGTQVAADGRFKVRGWFDNEWGFANRLLDLAGLIGGSRVAAPCAEAPVR